VHFVGLFFVFVTGLNCKVEGMVDLKGLASKALVYAKRVNRLEVRMTLK